MVWKTCTGVLGNLYTRLNVAKGIGLCVYPHVKKKKNTGSKKKDSKKKKDSEQHQQEKKPKLLIKSASESKERAESKGKRKSNQTQEKDKHAKTKEDEEEKEEQKVLYWCSIPKNPTVILLHQHGRRENVGESTKMLLKLKREAQRSSPKGEKCVIGVAAAEYPGYTPTDWGTILPTNTSSQNAVLLVLHALFKKYPTARIVIIGYSIGSGVSAWATTQIMADPKYRSRISGLALLSAFTSMRKLVKHHIKSQKIHKFVAPQTLVRTNVFNTQKRLCEISHHNPHLPILLVHGKDDDVIPSTHSTSLVRTLEKKLHKCPPKLCILKNSDHETLDWSPPLMQWMHANSLFC